MHLAICYEGSHHGCPGCLRVRGRAAPWWLAAAYITAIIPADSIMATSMLRGLKRRAGQTYTASVPVRPAADPGWPEER